MPVNLWSRASQHWQEAQRKKAFPFLKNADTLFFVGLFPGMFLSFELFRYIPSVKVQFFFLKYLYVTFEHPPDTKRMIHQIDTEAERRAYCTDTSLCLRFLKDPPFGAAGSII